MAQYVITSFQILRYRSGRSEIVGDECVGHPRRAADDAGLANLIPL